jgi:hypothetical protein
LDTITFAAVILIIIYNTMVCKYVDRDHCNRIH